MTKGRECYQPLVEIIEKLISEIEDCLSKLAAEESCEIEGMVFSLKRGPDREKLIQVAMRRAKSALDMIATRNQERHRELVELLLKKAELQRIIDGRPLYSGGLLRQLSAIEEMKKVKNRLSEIMEDTDETTGEAASVED